MASWTSEVVGPWGKETRIVDPPPCQIYRFFYNLLHLLHPLEHPLLGLGHRGVRCKYYFILDLGTWGSLDSRCWKIWCISSLNCVWPTTKVCNNSFNSLDLELLFSPMAKDRLWEETGDSCSDWELLGLGLSLNNNLFNFKDGEEQSSKHPFFTSPNLTLHTLRLSF
jgi:hypothetical protein